MACNFLIRTTVLKASARTAYKENENNARKRGRLLGNNLFYKMPNLKVAVKKLFNFRRMSICILDRCYPRQIGFLTRMSFCWLQAPSS